MMDSMSLTMSASAGERLAADDTGAAASAGGASTGGRAGAGAGRDCTTGCGAARGAGVGDGTVDVPGAGCDPASQMLMTYSSKSSDTDCAFADPLATDVPLDDDCAG